LIAAGAALLLASSAAWSFPSRSAAATDPTYRAAIQLIDTQRFAEAVPLLKQVVVRDPGQADAYSELGFALRKLGDYAAALAYYRIALQLDPHHLGATEYLGELYAESGDLPNAEAQLARVAEICHGPCEAFTDLESAIRRHQPRQAGG
jgi:tetratricopeptide (TPR) repeat protein